MKPCEDCGKDVELEPGLGFHELRCQLFFLRTLALYAARIEDLASLAFVLYELTEVTLSGRLGEVGGAVAIPMGDGNSEIAVKENVVSNGEELPDSQLW